MKISTKGRYGIRALIDLKMNYDKENVTIKGISERQEISERYLEQIFSALRKAGIIVGRKGAQGGYVLAKDASDITILEILNALEGDSLLIEINNEDCNDLELYINNNLWKEINDRINKYFASITLQDLVDGYKHSKEELVYFI